MSLLDVRHGEERVQTRRRELTEGRAPYTGPRWIFAGILAILVAALIFTVNADEAGAATPARPDAASVSADPGDQSWFLCVAHRPYGTGYVYGDFMVSSTIAHCNVDYTPFNGRERCPNIYVYEVWYTPAYGGWTGPHRIRMIC